MQLVLGLFAANSLDRLLDLLYAFADTILRFRPWLRAGGRATRKIRKF